MGTDEKDFAGFFAVFSGMTAFLGACAEEGASEISGMAYDPETGKDGFHSVPNFS
jgi:hypothetical protein